MAIRVCLKRKLCNVINLLPCFKTIYSLLSLSEQQLDSRRRGLEQYLEKVCAVRVIAESDAVQEFLTDSDVQDNVSPVDLKVLLPDQEIVTVTIYKSANAEEVYKAVVGKIGMSVNSSKYFYLFEIVEYNFGVYHKLILI